jgi:hypothetical protein
MLLEMRKEIWDFIHTSPELIKMFNEDSVTFEKIKDNGQDMIVKATGGKFPETDKYGHIEITAYRPFDDESVYYEVILH